MAANNHSCVPEGFKEIPGYEGRYFIDRQGQVWSVARNRLMSPQTDATHPYPWVLLTKPNKKKKPTNIYYLMRLTWMPPAPGEVGAGTNKWCVNHKDGNKLNSSLDNLEWTTNYQNAKHAWQNNLQAKGSDKKNAIFTSIDVTLIRLRVKYGESAYFISKEYKCAYCTIKKMCRFESWKYQDLNLKGRIRPAS